MLIFSSLVFITNVITCYYKKNFIHSFLFFLLTCSSVTVHCADNIITNTCDKIIIGLIIINGLFLFNKNKNKNKNIIIILTFLFVVFVYIYGYIKNKYVFDKNKNISNKYHLFMHLIGSLGHHLIII